MWQAVQCQPWGDQAAAVTNGATMDNGHPDPPLSTHCLNTTQQQGFQANYQKKQEQLY